MTFASQTTTAIQARASSTTAEIARATGATDAQTRRCMTGRRRWTHQELNAIESCGYPALRGDSPGPAGPAADDGTLDRGWRIDPADGSLVIRTLEGDMHANPGDWIIRGVAGELYPCRQDIFEQTYEPARCTPEPDSDLKEES